MPQISVVVCEFPGYGYSTQPDAADWVRETMWTAKRDPRISRVGHARYFGTPITMLRNAAMEDAVRNGFDFVVMVDSDMLPDHNSVRQKSDRPFFTSSLDFIFEKHLSIPTMVFAPYCGPSPNQNCYVFRWRTQASRHPNPDLQLEGYSREESIAMSGIVRAAAGPTGVIIIDTRVLKYISKPWFYYGYKDSTESKKNMTEDVAFTRDVAMCRADELGLPHGLPIYCNWDAWAVHWKMEGIGKPLMLTPDDVAAGYRMAAEKSINSNDKLVILGESPFDPPLTYTRSRESVFATKEGDRYKTPEDAILAHEDNGPQESVLEIGDQRLEAAETNTKSPAANAHGSQGSVCPQESASDWSQFNRITPLLAGRNGQLSPVASA